MIAAAQSLETEGDWTVGWLLPSAIWFLVLANIFDMGGVFGVKYISYAYAVCVLVLRSSACQYDRIELALVFGLLIVWPFATVAHGIAVGAALRDALGEWTPFLPGVLAYLLVRGTPPDRLLRVLMHGLVALALVTSLIFLLLLLAPGSNPAQAVLALFRDEGHGYFGVRQLGAISVPNVYFKATLFMVPAFGWFLFRRRYLPCAICLVGLSLSFSRAGVALALLLVATYMILGSIRQKVTAAILVTAAAAFVAANAELLQVSEYVARLQDALLGRDASSQARLGHMESLTQLLNRDFSTLWFGQGAGVPFYSKGTGGWVTYIELDHLDVIRQFGLAWFVLFAGLVLFIGKRVLAVRPDGTAAGVALLVAFFASGTNPVLINPLFMILLAAVAHLASGRGEYA